jgi:hypothetical protein
MPDIDGSLDQTIDAPTLVSVGDLQDAGLPHQPGEPVGGDLPGIPALGPGPQAIWTAIQVNAPYNRFNEGGFTWVFGRVLCGTQYYNSNDGGNPGAINSINPADLQLTRIYDIFVLSPFAWAGAVNDGIVMRWDDARSSLFLFRYGINTTNNNELNTSDNPNGATFDVLVRGI